MPPPSQRENERRKNIRFKVNVPFELYLEGKETPFRGATADLSLRGCYIESIFPFAKGTKVEIKLSLDTKLSASGKVVTSDPQVGNGIEFIQMLPEDVDQLKAFLDAHEKQAQEKDAAEKDGAAKPE
jgi:c-di-GMP-binding flagellar brake protein YcgR